MRCYYDLATDEAYSHINCPFDLHVKRFYLDFFSFLTNEGLTFNQFVVFTNLDGFGCCVCLCDVQYSTQMV